MTAKNADLSQVRSPEGALPTANVLWHEVDPHRDGQALSPRAPRCDVSGMGCAPRSSRISRPVGGLTCASISVKKAAKYPS